MWEAGPAADPVSQPFGSAVRVTLVPAVYESHTGGRPVMPKIKEKHYMSVLGVSEKYVPCKMCNSVV